MRILEEQQAGPSAAVVYRKRDVSNTHLYKWLSKFGGMEAEVKRDLGDFRRNKSLRH